MNNPEIKIYENAFFLSNALAEEFFRISEEYSRNKKNLFVALSGGNTPIVFFELLSIRFTRKINWRNIQFFWSDERCVPPDDPESNYRTAKRYLFDNIKIPEENIHRIRGEEGPFGEASRYTDVLLSNVPLKNNLPSLDLILLGLGEDGHAASLFPEQRHITDFNRICIVTVHPETGQRRITFTEKIINNAKHIIFLVSGKKKSEVVRKILGRKSDYEKYPAAHIKARDGKTEWLLDKYAAKHLENQKLILKK